MSPSAHLWAVGFDDMDRAEQVRKKVLELSGPGQYLFVLDTVVVVRGPDGSYTFNRGSHSTVGTVLAGGLLGVLACLALSVPPVTGAAVGAVLGCAGSTAANAVGLDDAFIRGIADLMRPSTSALFLLDQEGDMDVTLHAIRGLGGTVLKTNVDLERAKLIQATLRAEQPK